MPEWIPRKINRSVSGFSRYPFFSASVTMLPLLYLATAMVSYHHQGMSYTYHTQTNTTHTHTQSSGNARRAFPPCSPSSSCSWLAPPLWYVKPPPLSYFKLPTGEAPPKSFENRNATPMPTPKNFAPNFWGLAWEWCFGFQTPEA